MNPRLVPISLLLCCTGLAAQTTVVSPHQFTTIEGPAGNTHPLGAALGTSPSMRYMSIHDDMTSHPGVIRALSMRLNTGSTGVATNLMMGLYLSTSTSPAATASTTFDTNHGLDKVEVIPLNTPVNFGAIPPSPVSPSPFTYPMPFTVPFPYLGLGPLAWDLHIGSRTNTSAFSLDTAAGSTAATNSVFTLSGVNFGVGCLATGRTTNASASSSYSTGTNNVTLTAANLTASAPGAIVIGTSDTSWNSIPLPFPLPGTSCNILNNWLVEIAGTTSATGAFSFAFPLALGSNTLGATIYHYGFTLDQPANSFGIVTTNGRKTVFGDRSMITGTRIYAFNNVGAATGSKDTTAVVTQFTY